MTNFVIIKGMVFDTYGVTLGGVYVVDVTKNDVTDVCYVVYAKTYNPMDTRIIEYDKFLKLIETGSLVLRRETKYRRGQAFYGIGGNVYVIQYPSDITHEKDIGTKYFVTVIETFAEYCDEITKPRYILTEAIFSEKNLDSLEPADEFLKNIAEMELDELDQWLKAPEAAEGVNDCSAKTKGFKI